ncbi:hypothetical protein JD540_15505 [Aeromonas caviae]|nr:hypothetical protein [Aeromonas caviae]
MFIFWSKPGRGLGNHKQGRVTAIQGCGKVRTKST